MTDRPMPDQPADGERDPDRENGPSGPTIRDRRRIDPQTYQAREPRDTTAAPAPGGAGDQPTVADQPTDAVDDDPRLAELETQLGERTADLQRLQAEYVNYKRRVDRDRETARQATVATVMTELLGVLDDIASARQHGELTGAFKAVGESVEKLSARHGVTTFGEPGDPFDPNIHEALMQLPGAEDGHPVCAQVLQPGYRMGDRVLRPARVAVGAAPAEPPAAEPASEVASEEEAPADAGTTDADGPDGAADAGPHQAG